MSRKIIRCKWCEVNPLYIRYHDKEWGVPVFKDQKLFEYLLLETFQAGLSWIIVLKKRENIRIAFDNFNTEKIALGLKQKESSPWDDIEQRFPIQSKVTGKVVNLVSYGAFIHLEDGVEGLVHVSEMSWRKRINHPSEIINPGDEIEVIVLDIDKTKHEISLGMKQVESNPWELVAEKYPVGTIVSGDVRNLTNYGAFVEIEPGIDGLLGRTWS